VKVLVYLLCIIATLSTLDILFSFNLENNSDRMIEKQIRSFKFVSNFFVSPLFRLDKLFETRDGKIDPDLAVKGS
jgi:hypothetical protein